MISARRHDRRHQWYGFDCPCCSLSGHPRARCTRAKAEAYALQLELPEDEPAPLPPVEDPGIPTPLVASGDQPTKASPEPAWSNLGSAR